MGGLNSGSQRRSEKVRNGQLLRLSMAGVRRALGAALMERRIEAMRPYEAGLAVRATCDGSHEVGIVRNEGPATIPYGMAEALDVRSPRHLVPIAITQPSFGGVRYWFRCPRESCGRRCQVLYRERVSNARALACRQCVRVRYESQVLGDADLIDARVVRLLVRLDFQETGEIRRPRGMHAHTFQSIMSKLGGLVATYKRTSPLWRHCGRALDNAERRTGM